MKWYANSTGAAARGYRVFDGTGESVRFDGANGLGDLAALCPAAPLEIGNRIWRDGDGDGVEDPGEGGIAGVTVELYRDGGKVGATTTAADGTYLFNAANVKLGGASGIVAGLCGTAGAPVYTVRVPNAAGGSQQPALAGLLLTGAAQDGTTNGTLRDSDAQGSGNDAVAAVACAQLAAPGANDHTVDIGFRPSRPPTTAGQALVTAEDTPLAITLGAVSPENRPLTYSLLSTPTHGVLDGSLPNVTYTPAPDFFGADSFTFQANDGLFDSDVATITIAVQPVNDAPIAASQVVTTAAATAVAITLSAGDPDGDPDGDPLAYVVVAGPQHGTLAGTPPQVTYLPAAWFAGEDQFTFRAEDGAAASNLAAITIHVAAPAWRLYLPLLTPGQ